MTLHVPFKNFVAAVTRHLERPLVYLHKEGGTVLVSAADPAKGLLIMSTSDEPATKVRERLDHEGFSVVDGVWREGTIQRESAQPAACFIGAVAYRTREESPGLWVDAFPIEPTPATVLQAIYAEFEKHGELGQVSFEEFLRVAKPTVVVLKPEQIAQYLREKSSS
jgi:hypothetical protein